MAPQIQGTRTAVEVYIGRGKRCTQFHITLGGGTENDVVSRLGRTAAGPVAGRTEGRVRRPRPECLEAEACAGTNTRRGRDRHGSRMPIGQHRRDRGAVHYRIGGDGRPAECHCGGAQQIIPGDGDQISYRRGHRRKTGNGRGPGIYGQGANDVGRRVMGVVPILRSLHDDVARARDIEDVSACDIAGTARNGEG